MNCQLCKKDTILKNSHFTPSFVFDWLKKTSATGYLRQAGKLNVRKQSGNTAMLLCGNCELKLSKWEGYFAKEIFYPFHSNYLKPTYTYGSWLKKFVVSLNWRSIIYTKNDPSMQLEKYLKTMSQWEDFMMEKRKDTDGEHHIVFIPGIESTDNPSIPQNFHTYILRMTDPCPFYNQEGTLGVYTKIPGILLISFINPPSPKEWQGSKIEETGKIYSKQIIKDNLIFPLMFSRADKIREMNLKNISEKQKKVIENSIVRNPQRAVSSLSYSAYLQDQNTNIDLSHLYRKIGKNDLCPCRSGKKWKKCCMLKRSFIE